MRSGTCVRSSPLRRARSTACAAIVLLSATLVAIAGSESPRSYLDEETAATVTVVAKPLTFAREYPTLAVNARDYISLCAVQVNRSGRFEVYLLGYVWSTIDRRGESKPDSAAAAQLTLLADDREFPLLAVTTTLKAAGMGQVPCKAPHRRSVPHLYATDGASLAYIASAQYLIVRTAEGRDVDPYRLWTDTRIELRQFADAVNRRGR